MAGSPVILGNSRLGQLVNRPKQTTQDYLSMLLGKPAPESTSNPSGLGLLGVSTLDSAGQPIASGAAAGYSQKPISDPMEQLVKLGLASGPPGADGINPDGSPHFDTTGPLTGKQFSKTQGKSGKGKSNPYTFAAALRLASKELGPFDSSPYDSALSEIEGLAQSQRQQTRRSSNRAQESDAVLYGHLNNYIKQIAQSGRQDTRQTLQGLNKDYNDLGSTIAHTYGGAETANNRELARMGLAGTDNNASENYALSRAATSKAESKGNERSSGDAFDKLMKQTRGDVVATGTGKVADEKASLQTALSQISQSLMQQSGGIDQAQAGAESSYHSQLRTAAMGLLSQMQKSDPNSLANQKAAADLAGTIARDRLLQHQLATGGSTSGTTPQGFQAALAYLNQEAKLGPKKGGFDPTHLGTMESFLTALSQGGSGGLAPTEPSRTNVGTILHDADNLIAQQPQSKSWYQGPNKAALEQAVRILLGAQQ